jgi:uncharacterized protein (TIGR02996 family)
VAKSESGWWDEAEWLAFCRGVEAEPADDTVRLVAADWLDERNDPLAACRAALIREQIARTAEGAKPYWMWTRGPFHWRQTVKSEVLLEQMMLLLPTGHPMLACSMLEMERGFVRTAAWHPWTFSTENAAPVMKAEPVLRAEITVIRPFIDETDGGASWGESGPEDDAGWLPEDGRIRILSGFLPDDPDPDLNTAGGRMTRAMEIVRRGESLHRTIYVQNPGLLPGPVWDHLPRERGDTVNGWRHFAPAVQAAYKATWRCARAWAGMPYKTRKLPLAVEAWRMDALRNVADLYRDGAVEHPMFQE